MALPALLLRGALSTLGRGALSTLGRGALSGIHRSLLNSLLDSDVGRPSGQAILLDCKVHGLPELKRALQNLPPRIRRQAVRPGLRQAGRVIAAAAKAAAPVLAVPSKTRRPGTIKRAIRVGSSKFARRAGDEGVFIGVRPLRGARQAKLGKAGATNPNDPYYWRFVEFGTGPHRIAAGAGRRLALPPKFPRVVSHPGAKGARFMTSAAQQRGAEAVAIFLRHTVPRINAMNRPG